MDSLLGGAILTDTETYNWVREYILSSFYTYSAKDAALAIHNGKRMCPLRETALEIKDSLGMDLLFVGITGVSFLIPFDLSYNCIKWIRP